MQTQIDSLKQQVRVEHFDDFDPKEEFEEIKSLCSLHRVDFDNEDIV